MGLVSSNLYVKDVITENMVWFKFARKLEQHLNRSQPDGAASLTAALMSMSGKNKKLNEMFIVDYESDKDRELMQYVNYFDDRIANLRLNMLHMKLLEQIYDLFMVNDILVQKDRKGVWIPVGLYFVKMSTLEIELSAAPPSSVMDNLQIYDFTGARLRDAGDSFPTSGFPSTNKKYPKMIQAKSFDDLSQRTEDNINSYQTTFSATGTMVATYRRIIRDNTSELVGYDDDDTKSAVGTGVIKTVGDEYYIDTLFHCSAKTLFLASTGKVIYDSKHPNRDLISLEFHHPALSDPYSIPAPFTPDKTIKTGFWDYKVLFKLPDYRGPAPDLKIDNDGKNNDNDDVKISSDDDGTIKTTGYPTIGKWGYLLRNRAKTTSIARGLLYPIEDYIIIPDIMKEATEYVDARHFALHDGKCIVGFSGGDAFSGYLNRAIGKQQGMFNLPNGVLISAVLLDSDLSQEKLKEVSDQSGRAVLDKIDPRSFEEMFRYISDAQINAIRKFGGVVVGGIAVGCYQQYVNEDSVSRFVGAWALATLEAFATNYFSG